jgi:hypothetical protein
VGAGEQVMDPADDFLWRINRDAALNEWWRDLGSGTIPALSISNKENK